jgi:hypothetical protein
LERSYHIFYQIMSGSVPGLKGNLYRFSIHTSLHTSLYCVYYHKKKQLSIQFTQANVDIEIFIILQQAPDAIFVEMNQIALNFIIFL